MPGKGHHSQEWHDCWEKVQAKGHSPESAAAICTKALQDAGKDIMASDAEASTPYEWTGDGAIGKPFKVK